MSDAAADIRRIPIASISIMNPRVRGKKGFRELVASIATLGLKKPVTVRSKQNGQGYCQSAWKRDPGSASNRDPSLLTGAPT